MKMLSMVVAIMFLMGMMASFGFANTTTEPPNPTIEKAKIQETISNIKAKEDKASIDKQSKDDKALANKKLRDDKAALDKKIREEKARIRAEKRAKDVKDLQNKATQEKKRLKAGQDDNKNKSKDPAIPSPPFGSLPEKK